MSAGRLKSTFLPDRVLADHLGDVFRQPGPTADFTASIIHPPLWFIPPLHKVRVFLIWLVNNFYFVGGILVLIVINSVFLAMDDPKVQDNDTFNSVLQISDFVFLLIFTVEMLLKIAAYGFALHTRSYLRDPWNILDGLVVAAGLATIIISGKITGGGGGVSALRVVRVFRPLRTVSKVRSLKHILTKVMTSLPSMRDVFVLLLFVSWLAAIAGVQIYIGVLNNRCYGNTNFYNYSTGDVLPTAIRGPGNVSIRDHWHLIQNDTKICSRGSGGYQCTESGVSVPVECRVDRSQYSSSYLSFDNIGTGFLLAFKLVSRDNWPVDLDNVVFATSPLSFFYFFVLTFFGGYFCLNLFIAVLTGAFSEGEEDDTTMIDTRVRFSAMIGGGVVGDAACFACHHSNSTVEAVQRYAREHGEDIEAVDTDAQSTVPGADKGGERRRTVAFVTADDEPPLIRRIPSKVPDSPTSLDFDDNRPIPPTAPEYRRRRQDGGGAAAGGAAGASGATVVAMDEDSDDDDDEPATALERLERFFQKTGFEPLRRLVTGLPYELTVLFIIFVNAVVLSLDSRDASQTTTDVVSNTSYVCNWIFIGDVILKIIGLGPSFCIDASNWFDLGLALLSIPDLIASENSSFSALRAFRLIRLLRLARQWRSLQQLLRLVKDSVQSVASLSLVSLIVIYIYAILGFQLFNTDIPDQRFSFGNVFDSLLTVFVIVTGENWATIMEGIMEEKGVWTFVYFLSLFVVGNFFIANLFIAIIIDNFSTVSKTEEDDDEEQGQDPDEALAMDMMMMRLEHAKASGPSSRHDLDHRIFLDVTSDDDDDNAGITDLDPTDAEASSLLGGRPASSTNLGDGMNSGRNAVREASVRRAKGATTAAKVIGARLDLETTDEVEVVQEFTAEFGIQPHSVGIVGNPSELRSRAERELEQLESTRAANKRRQRRLDQLVSSAVSRIKRRVLRKTQLPTHLQLIDHKRRSRVRTVTVAEREMDLEEWGGLQFTSLICLKPDNPVREALAAFLRHYATQVLLVFLTLYSSVMLALDDDDITGGNDSVLAQIIRYSDYVIAASFVAEMTLKMVVLGVVGHPGAYFRNKWNILDFFVTVAAIVALVVPEAKPVLALRALRLTSLSFNLKVVVEALLSALPGMGSVMVFMGLLWWIFAVLGVALFKGVFYECNDGVSGRWDCVGTFNKTVQGAFETTVEETARDWYSPMPSSRFDNIYEALYSLLKVSLSDGWFDIMYYAVDSQGADLPRKRNGSQESALYFIAFMIIGNFFTINLFVGVLADRFVSLRQRGEGFHLISENQRQWVMAQKVLFRSQIDIIPVPPKNAFRNICFRMAQHPAFDAIFTGLIVLNSVILSMYYFGMSEEYEFALDTTGLVILCLFTVEMFIKVVGYNPIVYWRNPWNRLDFIVVLLSWVGVAVGNGIAVVRLFRVFRLFLLLRKMKGVQTMFITLYQAVPELINVGVVLVVVYFLFAILGVFLFGSVARSGPLNDLVNFDHAGNALVALYIATTTEGWAEIADALRVEEPNCSKAAGTCGTPYAAYPYMIIFMVLMSLILMNLLVTVVLGNFLDARVAEGQESLFDVIDHFRDRWTEHDPTATQQVDVSVILRLLPTLPSSIWDRSVPKIRGKQRSVWIHFLRQLEKFHIPLGRDHTVHYSDAIASIAGRLFCISVTDAIEASQRTAHGITWHGRTLSVHQHFAAIKLTRAVRHYLSTRGERILTQELRELREQHAVMLEVEYEPLRRSHRDTTVLCRWLIGRMAETRTDQRALEEATAEGPLTSKTNKSGLTRRSRALSKGPQTPTRAFGQTLPGRQRTNSGADLTSRAGSSLTQMPPRQATIDAVPLSPIDLPTVPALPKAAMPGAQTTRTDPTYHMSPSEPAAATAAHSSPSPDPPNGRAGVSVGHASGGHALHADPSAEIAALQLDRHRNWRQDNTSEPFGGQPKIVAVDEPVHSVSSPNRGRRALTPDSD